MPNPSPGRRERRRRRGWPRLLAVACALLMAGAACGGGPGSPVERGDRALGSGRVEEAIAEYKLALRRSADDPEILLRLGLAYAGQGEVEASLGYFARLLELDSAYRYEVAAHLGEAARVSLERGARDNMARALEPMVEMGVGLIPVDLRLELARYYAEAGERGRALPLYLSVVTEEGGDSIPAAAWFETARAFQEMGGCREAVDYFERFQEADAASSADRTAAEWYYGTCLFQVAADALEDGREGDALRRLDRMIELGSPRPLLDRAHFSRAEIHLRAGRRQAALDDLERVLELNPVRTGSLVQQAESRLRQIRYGFE